RNRTNSVAESAAIFEFAISACESFKSAVMVFESCLKEKKVIITDCGKFWAKIKLTSGGNAYHDMNAIITPNVEKTNVRPYWLIRFNTGTECAFPFSGFMLGAVHNVLSFMVCIEEVKRIGVNFKQN